MLIIGMFCHVITVDSLHFQNLSRKVTLHVKLLFEGKKKFILVVLGIFGKITMGICAIW